MFSFVTGCVRFWTGFSFFNKFGKVIFGIISLLIKILISSINMSNEIRNQQDRV